MRLPLIVPENRRVDELLDEFRRSSVQLAIIQDEYGGTAGWSRSKTCWKNWWGRSRTNTTRKTRCCCRWSRASTAWTPAWAIDDLNEHLDLDLPHEDFDTVGGFVFGQSGRQPEEGESVHYEDLEFVVEKTDGRRVDKIRLIMRPDDEPLPEEVRHDAGTRAGHGRHSEDGRGGPKAGRPGRGADAGRTGTGRCWTAKRGRRRGRSASPCRPRPGWSPTAKTPRPARSIRCRRAIPDVYTALATDGSQIPLDRHAVAPCFLLNVGEIVLHYGTGERPGLTSRATLHYRDEELFTSEGSGDPVPLSDKIIANRRLLAESAALAALIEAHRDRHAIALVDDPLIVWTPQGESEAEQRRVIDGFCQMLSAGQAAGTPVAGYVSRPGHRDVVGALRLTLCEPGCAHDPKGLCAKLAHLTDAQLYRSCCPVPATAPPSSAAAPGAWTCTPPSSASPSFI